MRSPPPPNEQPLLFSVIGIALDFKTIAPDTIPLAIGIIAIGTLAAPATPALIHTHLCKLPSAIQHSAQRHRWSFDEARDWAESAAPLTLRQCGTSAAGLAIRLPVAGAVLWGGNLNVKEKAFIALSWVPKVKDIFRFMHVNVHPSDWAAPGPN